MNTLGHWPKGCPSAHYFRVTRHDAVVQFIKAKLEPTFTVYTEWTFATAIGLQKLDLVVVCAADTFVINI